MLQLIKGNPGGRPLNRDEPIPEGDLYAPPETFSESQKVIWREAIDNAPRGLLRRLDGRALRVWVIAADLHDKAVQQVEKYGMIVKSPTQGVPVQSPYLAIINRQAEIMMRQASALGFDPTSRSRITLAGGGKKETNRFANNAAKRA